VWAGCNRFPLKRSLFRQSQENFHELSQGCSPQVTNRRIG
jgi:hypothetical protein